MKGTLSARNQVLWEEVSPLVLEAWEVASTVRLVELAQEIARRLGLAVVPPWLGEGDHALAERSGSDAAEWESPDEGPAASSVDDEDAPEQGHRCRLSRQRRAPQPLSGNLPEASG